jgi:hypothetical protein
MTTWEIDGDRWRLLGYNDAVELVAAPAPVGAAGPHGHPVTPVQQA